MKFSQLAVVAALLVSSSSAITLQGPKGPPPTAADTPTSGYYGADEDDVMNNIFSHYAVPITNAAGQATGTMSSIRMVPKRLPLRSSSSPSKFLRLRWRPTWPKCSQEPGLSSISTTLVKLILPSPTLS